jgi:hypothetical protein
VPPGFFLDHALIQCHHTSSLLLAVRLSRMPDSHPNSHHYHTSPHPDPDQSCPGFHHRTDRHDPPHGQRIQQRDREHPQHRQRHCPICARRRLGYPINQVSHQNKSLTRVETESENNAGMGINIPQPPAPSSHPTSQHHPGNPQPDLYHTERDPQHDLHRNRHGSRNGLCRSRRGLRSGLCLGPICGLLKSALNPPHIGF